MTEMEKIYIIVTLTKKRMKKLQEAKDLYGFNKVWTNDRKVMLKENHSRLTKPIAYDE